MNLKNIGKVLAVKDGIIFSDGLSQIGYNEVVNIKTDNEIVQGLALNLEESRVGIIALSDFSNIKEGNIVEATGKQLSINVSEDLMGHIINPLGYDLEQHTQVKINNGRFMPLEKIAPGIIDRKDITGENPMNTGIMAIDSMIPIGRGQRELIIGDRQTGKTSICIDTIIHQKGKDLFCIYVAIGQKASKIARIKKKLEEVGAMDYTVIVAANASDPAAMQFIAPYAGCAIGEYFAESGKHALVIYDDLTKHAWAYREISLLLRRPPGREAYPGDIFYLHSRLLERAMQFSDDKGKGSLTALPIIETQAGDVSAYIPTNIISITDGQIFLESELFNAGQKPAINIGISVSRVGGSAQVKAMKQVAGKLKLDLAQYRELATFAQFGSELDSETQKKLDRGAILTEILKQDQYNTIPVEIQVIVLFAATNGYIDKYELSEIQEWKNKFIEKLSSQKPQYLEKIKNGAKIENELENEIIETIETFNKEYKKL